MQYERDPYARQFIDVGGPEPIGAGDQADVALTLLRGSEIKVTAVSWIWPTWLAAGKLHILGGVPGTGKTTIALSLAATITQGTPWPDGSQAPVPGNVLIWSGEDEAADTLIPRLTAMNADLDRVFIISDVKKKGHHTRAFDPAQDVPALIKKALEMGDVRLLIVDPVSVAVSGDSHKNTEVRRGLAPLVAFAQKLDAAVLGITHFSKGTVGRDPLDRLTGSLAFGAAPRLVFAATKVSGQSDAAARSLFVRVKSNIGPDGGGFEYSMEKVTLAEGVETAGLAWGKSIEGEARDILAVAEQTDQPGERTALAEAEEFLEDLLAHGPVDASEIFRRAQQAEVSGKTLRRAKKSLGVQSDKNGKEGGWIWSLPKMPMQIEDGQPYV